MRALLVVFLVLTASASAQTFTVTSTADPGDGTCDGTCTLREALAEANAVNGTVEFDTGLAGATIALTAGQLEATGDVTIDGTELGITVSGADLSRVLYIAPGATVAVSGLTLADGNVDTEGGAFGGNVLHEGDGLTLTDVVVRDGSTSETFAFARGGGVAAFGPLTMMGGAVRNNYADARGAGLYLVGTSVITNVRIENNDGGDGAGVHVVGMTEIRGTVLQGNAAGCDGGGIFVASSGSLIISHSEISENEAGLFCGGAGIYADGPATVEYTTISSNIGGDSGGGGIRVDVSASLDHVTITKNLDGIFVAGGGTADLTSTIIGGNSRYDCEAFASGIITSLGYNVTESGSECPTDGPGDVSVTDIFADVLDAALADNGGPTRTHALLDPPGNPALDIGGTCGPTDQRGFPAPVNGVCDAGAVERGADTPALMVDAIPSMDPVQTPAGSRFAFEVAITVPAGGPASVDGWGEAITPSGRRVVVYQPRAVAVTPGATTTVRAKQAVPSGAAPGTYTYIVHVGTYPTAEASDSFEVVVSGGDLAKGGATDWEGEWGVDDAPEAFALAPPVPNPARGTVTLTYDLAESGPVRLEVFDSLGRRVADVASGYAEAGRQRVTFDAGGLVPGAYLVRLDAGGRVLTRPLTVVR